MRATVLAGMASAAMALAATSSVQAQPPTGPIKVHALSSTVYWAEGGVGNTGFIVGDKGVIVIDATISQASAKQLLADIAQVTPKPVTTVILTHGDIDHVGGLGAFPASVTVIAQPNNRASQASAEHPNVHPVASRETMDIDGVKLSLLHWAPAHTAGDLVIYVPAQKIVFTGDIFAMDQPRALIHLEQHGSSEGWVETARGIVALDADRFVVGHGQVQDKATLQARVDLVTHEREQIKALVAKGESLTQIEAEVGDPPPGQSAGGPGGPRFTPFSEVVYQELTGKN